MVLTDLRKRIHFQFFLYIDQSVRGAGSLSAILNLPTQDDSSLDDTLIQGIPLLESYRHFEESGGWVDAVVEGNLVGVEAEVIVMKTRLEYLQMIVDYYWEKQLMGEALIALQNLFGVWEGVGEVMKKKGGKEHLGDLACKLRKARYFVIQTYVFRACSMLEESYEASIKGLELLDQPIPITTPQFISHAIRCGKQMRKYLKRLKRTGETIQITVNNTLEEPASDALDEMLILVRMKKIVVQETAGLGVLVGRPAESALAAASGLARSGNIFAKTFNMKRATSYIYGDQFRCVFNGSHTAASIALLVLNYTQELLNSSSIPLNTFPDIAAKFSLEVGSIRTLSKWVKMDEEGVESANGGREEKEDEGGLRVEFRTVGQGPVLFTIEGGQYLHTVAAVCRNRDLFALQERYNRIASVIL
ncbi:hypothetical protein HDU67_002625 [Dinochytrium kinnereticum]|nr:hypothetical protein HDU67_002625 [Dinochytrium kinnereticum]